MSIDDNELPPGWAVTTLGEIVTPSKTKIEPQDSAGSPYLSLEHIESRTGQLLGQGLAKDVTSTKAVFNAGDVLYGRLRPYLNKVCVPPFAGVCSTDILVFRESGAILNRFLAKFLAQRSVVEFATQNAQGINLPRVSFDALAELPIHLPPLAEQRRIMDRLDLLEARSRSARAALEAVGPLLEQFRRSVLAAAFRGDLTVDWRAAHPDTEPADALLARIRQERRRKWEGTELARMTKRNNPPEDEKWQGRYKTPPPVRDADLPELPRGWCWASVDELSTKVADGVHRKPNYVAEGVPFITVKNLTAGPGISFEQVNYVSPADHAEFTKRTKPEKGDVLVTKDGTLGVVRRITTDAEFSIFVSVALIKPTSDTIGEFLTAYLEAPQGQASMKATGSGLQHIHLVDLRAALVPLPPLEEQREILDRVSDRLRRATAVETALRATWAQLSSLDQSLLAKAFRGELVPQDPSDEPASDLLDGIRAERIRDADGTNTKTRRQRTARSPLLPSAVEIEAPAPAGNCNAPPDPFDDVAAGPSAMPEAVATAIRPPRVRPSKIEKPVPPRIDDTDRDEVMAALRDLFADGAARDRDTAVRDLAAALGFGRVGARIREVLDNDLRTAVRRGILENTLAGLHAHCRSIADYDRDFLLTQLTAGMGPAWWDRDALVQSTARWLGFRRTGPVIHDALKATITLALRRGLLEPDGERVRKAAR